VDVVSVGQVVRANAGRDKGNTYLVVGLKVPNGVWLADGRKRRIAKPKMKNIRHISVLELIDKSVAEKLTVGAKVTDEDIRQALRACECTGE